MSDCYESSNMLTTCSTTLACLAVGNPIKKQLLAGLVTLCDCWEAQVICLISPAMMILQRQYYCKGQICAIIVLHNTNAFVTMLAIYPNTAQPYTSQIANNFWLIFNLHHKTSMHLHHHAVRNSWLFSVQVAQQLKCIFWSTGLFHHNQPVSKQSQINFKLAAQAKWTFTFISMLWGIAGYSLFR